MRHDDRETLGRFFFRWFMVLVALTSYAVVGSFDYADALEQEAMEKEAQPAREAPILDNPLPYAFTARDCLPSGRLCGEVRYYIPTRHQETQR